MGIGRFRCSNGSKKMIKTVEACLWCKSKELENFAYRKDGVGILKCNNCQLYMVDKIPENLDEYYYDETYYNAGEENVDTGYAEMYDLMAPSFLFWQNSLIEEANEDHKKKNFLEIGCATGNLLEMIEDNQKNLNLEGIDISEYAVNTTKAKGLNAQVAYIEKLVSKPKKDIIFSSETMEHLDDLKSFLQGVASNLSDDGTFLFYVPSISVKDAKTDKDYVRFNTNLEHLLHFTPEFFESELPKFFDAKVVIKEFITGFGPCIVGAVSKDPKNLVNLKILFDRLTNNSVPDGATDTLLKNLIIISLKFAQFELAEKTLNVLEKRKSFDPRDLLLVRGLLGYHNGNLNLSSTSFEEYLKAYPGNRFAIRSLLSNEREFSKLLQGDINRLSKEGTDLQARVFTTEAELRDLKQSKIVGGGIKLRYIVGKSLDPIRNSKIKLEAKSRRLAYLLTPKALREPVKRIIKLEWLIKTRQVINQKYPAIKPLLSVVIPYYNAGATIDETINSLRTQTFCNFEIILVNDGSSDQQSTDKLESLDHTGLNLKIVNQTNMGVALARNNGIKESVGKYVVCLDADDMLDKTYLEKCLIVLETSPDVDIVFSDMRLFGVRNLIYKQSDYNPAELINNNMVVTASMFDKSGWEKVGGYKSDLGYEDWNFWISLAEKGYWGRHISEPLFNYRTAVSSRYIDDQGKHKTNLNKIKHLHPNYAKNIRAISRKKHFNREIIKPDSTFVNLDNSSYYDVADNNKPNILITVPWMTFGGAETLITNYCREIKDSFNLTFMTGLKSEHEWEYKFKEITPNIYHLANLFEDKEMYLEFISNYILTRNIDVLHIIHNGFMFDMLPEIKRRHPKLKVVVTMFNDWVEYFQQSVGYKEYIDMFVSDNQKVATNYTKQKVLASKVTVIPNGINCYEGFSPTLFNRQDMRSELKIEDDDLAVFFVGRLSEEKNPDVYIEAAKKLIIADKKIKLKFFVIGDGPMRPDVEKAIKDVDSDKITYLGYQSEIAKYLSSADIFVLPSRIEGFPLSILEAMAMQVAVIASDVGAVAQVVESGKTGFVIKPGSTDEIATVIKTLRKDPELLKKIKESARKAVENKYSNIVLGENYKNLYNRMKM